MSKEMMNSDPKFEKILSDVQSGELEVHILNELGILKFISGLSKK
jgi:hypothetical protein